MLRLFTISKKLQRKTVNLAGSPLLFFFSLLPALEYCFRLIFMLTESELLAVLEQCIGTTQYFHHELMRGFVYTDGIKMLAEGGGAYWLINLIASW